MSQVNLSPAAARALLEWQIAMGADEAIDRLAPDRLAPPAPAVEVRPARPAPATPAVVAPPPAYAAALGEAAQSARALAAGAATIEELGALVAAFDGCALKRTATS